MRKVVVLISLLLALVLIQTALAHAGGRVFFRFGHPVYPGVVAHRGFYYPPQVIVVPQTVIIFPQDRFMVRPHRRFVFRPYRFGTFADPFTHRLGVVGYGVIEYSPGWYIQLYPGW